MIPAYGIGYKTSWSTYFEHSIEHERLKFSICGNNFRCISSRCLDKDISMTRDPTQVFRFNSHRIKRKFAFANSFHECQCSEAELSLWSRP